MTLIAIIAILFLVSLIAMVWKTEQLNVDPLQDALTMLVRELASEGNTPDAKRRFSELAAAQFDRFHIGHLPAPMLRLRLGHALLNTKPQLSLSDLSDGEFKEMERFLQNWEMPSHRPETKTATNTLSENADLFLSYAREDQDAVRIVAAQLSSAGFKIWWDDGLHAGALWNPEIEARLAAACAVIVLWSPYSSVSEWVRREAQYAKASGKIVPAFIRKCRLPTDLADVQTIDLTQWDGSSADAEWQKLISAARRLSAANA